MVFSVIACFGFIFSVDLLLHVGLLMPLYLSVDAIRNAPAIDPLRHQWYTIYQLVYAFVISVFYVCWRYRSANDAPRGALYRDGAGFGGFIGLMVGITYASLYIYLPIPGTLAMSWALGELVKGLGLGLILTAVYPKPVTSAA